MTQVMEAYAGGLGLDDHRNFYILDGRTGEFLASSQGRDETPFRELTPNMTAAMGGRTGQEITALAPYFDVALPLDGGAYVLAVVDDKGELDELTWTMFTILLRSLMFGLAVAFVEDFMPQAGVKLLRHVLVSARAQVFAGRGKALVADAAGVVAARNKIGRAHV